MQGEPDDSREGEDVDRNRNHKVYDTDAEGVMSIMMPMTMSMTLT